MASQRTTPDRAYEENEYEAVKGDLSSSQVLVLREKEGQKNSFKRIAIYIEETASKDNHKRVGFLDVRSGKRFLSGRESILGVLKPEYITEKDKLMLALIKPVEERNREDIGFWAYCYLKNGTYQRPVRLYSKRELEAYVRLQKTYQNRLMVCDSDDYIVLEIQEGRLIFPTTEHLAKGKDQAVDTDDKS